MTAAAAGTTVLRCITPSEHDAATNMAIDQAILESVDRGGPATLRFYTWAEPTLSLGYFQRREDRRLHPASESIACVRRSSGGGAIVHHHELTYSLTVPVRDGRIGTSSTGLREDLYRTMHHAVIDVLRRHGIACHRWGDLHRSGGDEAAFLCFQRRSPDDLIVAGYKVLGSAQRRARRAILQHGSLLLRASPFATELPGVTELSGVTSGRDQALQNELFADQIIETVTGHRDWRASSGRLSEAEHANSRRIRRDRFAAPAWLERR